MPVSFGGRWCSMSVNDSSISGGGGGVALFLSTDIHTQDRLD